MPIKSTNPKEKYEISLKRDLIRYLIKIHNKSDLSITTELPFCGLKRRADVVAVNGHSYAYEIKTAKDNLDKLAGQLSDYKKVFDYVWAVIEEPHLSSTKKLLPPNIGLILYREGEFLEVRKAKQNKRKNKYMLSYFIDNSVLRRMIPSNIKKNVIIHEIRTLACKVFSIQTLTMAANASIKQKYKNSSNEFYKYIGETIALDDILMLNANNIKKLLLPTDT